MSSWSTALWSAGALLAGFIAAFLQNLYTEQRQDRREVAARKAARDTAARERREEFELEHLVEVHALLNAQWHALMAFDDAMSAYRGALGSDSELPYPDRLWNELREAERAVTITAGFILADDIRKKVSAAQHEGFTHGLHARDSGELNVIAAAHVFATAFEALTARVREIYAGRAERGL